MKFKKVFSKLMKGFVFGGVASVAANPQAIGADDATSGLIVGILMAILNFWKHKDDN